MEDLVNGVHFVEDAADVEAKKLRLQQEQGETALFNSASRYRYLIRYHGYFCVAVVTSMLPWLLYVIMVSLYCHGYLAQTSCSNDL